MTKKHISIMLDERIIREFKRRSELIGRGYQTLINDALLEIIKGESVKSSMLEELIRKIVREETKS